MYKRTFSFIHRLISEENRIKYHKIIFYLVAAAAILWAIPLINRGVDVTDTGYYLAKYKYVFDSSVDIRSGTILLTEIVGGLLYRLTDRCQILILHISTWICYLLSDFLVYNLLKRKKYDIYVLIACIIGTMYSFSWIKAFNYNTLSMIIQLIAMLFLLYGIKKDQSPFFLGSGAIVGINIFVRIPNILQFVYVLCIAWSYGIIQHRWKDAWKNTAFFAVGAMIGTAVSFLIVLFFIGFNNFSEMLCELLAEIGNANSGHGMGNMLERVYEGIEHGVQMWSGKLLVVMAFLCVFFAITEKRTEKIRKYTFCVVLVAVCLLGIRWGIGFQSPHYMYEMAAAFFIVTTFSFLFLKFSDVFSSTTALLVLLSELILTIGTDNGWYYQSVYMIFPIAVVMTLWRDYIQNCSKRKYLIIIISFIFTVISSYGVKLGLTNVYRDGSYDELTSSVDVSVCEGMLTTASKADALERLESEIKKYEDSQMSLAVLGDCPIAYVFSDLTPFFSQPWPDLQSFGYDQFQEEIDEKFKNGEYPMVVFANFDQDDYAMMDENKKNYILKVMTENQYSMVYRDDYFTCYIRN